MTANLSFAAKTIEAILDFYPLRKLIWINHRHNEQVLRCLFNKHERYSVKATLFGWKHVRGDLKIHDSKQPSHERE
jgi:hypothetical protein